MSSFVTNNYEYNIISETEVADILSHFDFSFILDLISKYLEMRETAYTNVPNIVHSLEDQFRMLKTQHPYMADQLESTRIDVYREIIRRLCLAHNLTFNPNIDVDYYTAANYLWDFLVSNYREYIINFYTRYIINEKDGLYSALNLDQFKKAKDSTTIYGRMIYDDNQIVIICANIAMVLNYISGFDISVSNILSLSYDINTANYISSLIIDNNGTFFQDNYCKSLNNNLGIFITDIRLSIQKLFVSQETPITMLKEDQ